MPVDEMRRTQLPGTVEEPFHPLPRKGHLDAACERVEGEPASLQGIVAIPDEIAGRFRTLHPGPRMAMSPNTLVAGNDRCDHRLGHWRPQPKLGPQGPICVRLQRGLLEGMRRVNDSRDGMASVAIASTVCWSNRACSELGYNGTFAVKVSLLRLTYFVMGLTN